MWIRNKILDKLDDRKASKQACGVDPDAPRVSSEMLPAASHDLVAGEQLGAVLDAFLLTSQPRERYKQAKSKKNSEFQTCRAHLSLVAGIDLFELCSGKLTTVSC